MRRVSVAVALLSVIWIAGARIEPAVSDPATLTIVPSDVATTPDAGSLTAIVLYDQQFLTPGNSNVATVTAIVPRSKGEQTLTWAVTPPHVVLGPQFAGQANAPPGGAIVHGVSPGKATLSVRTAKPVRATATMSVFYYLTATVGCNFRNALAGRFDPDAAGLPQTASPDADLYVTGPYQIDSSSLCRGTPYTTPDLPVTIHVPYGGVLVENGEPEFSYIAPSAWRNDFTSITADDMDRTLHPCGQERPCGEASRSVLLFKTRGGRIVKLLIVSGPGDGGVTGPYETTSADGFFPY